MSILVKPDPRAVKVEFTDQMLVVYLADGRRIETPLEWFPTLRKVPAGQKNKWHLIGGGVGIHWDILDEDISVEGLLSPQNVIRKADAA